MSIKQAIEALEDCITSMEMNPDNDHRVIERARAALAALRSMPAEPYAYAVYFPKEFREELAHNLDELLDDLTNCEHTTTPLYATPHTAPLSDAEILALWSGSDTALRPVLGGRKVIAFARAIERTVLGRGGEQ